jgi:hypothetical protein
VSQSVIENDPSVLLRLCSRFAFDVALGEIEIRKWEPPNSEPTHSEPDRLRQGTTDLFFADVFPPLRSTTKQNDGVPDDDEAAKTTAFSTKQQAPAKLQLSIFVPLDTRNRI